MIKDFIKDNNIFKKALTIGVVFLVSIVIASSSSIEKAPSREGYENKACMDLFAGKNTPDMYYDNLNRS